MWVTSLMISQVKKGFFAQKRPNLAQHWHFWSIWARPCRLIQCPVGGSVVGCGARAVSRKTPIYFINHYSLFIIHHPLPSSLKAWTTRPPPLQLLVCAASKRICSERSGSTASPIYPGEEDLDIVQKSKEVIIANPSKSSSAKRLKY